MRRLIALSLTMMFSWSLIAPIFGPGADANLPPCCRRNGKHRCMMRMMHQPGGNRKGFTSVTEKCPCQPASTCAVYSPVFKPETGSRFCGQVIRRPACAPLAEGVRCIPFLRSYPKRGPPTPLA
jgi:hypothetical protein